MLKKDYFLLAMSKELYKKKAWTISAFSLIREDFSAWKENPYPLRLVQTPTGYFYVNLDNLDKLEPIEDGIAGQPLFNFKEQIDLVAGQVPNLQKDITTKYGNVFFNYSVLINSFGTKIEFQEGRISVTKLEDRIAKSLEDTPEEGVERRQNLFYVDEKDKFSNSILFLTNFTQLCVWAATEKALIPPPGIKEFKATLLEKYKDRLHDPSVIAMIDAELVKFDTEFLKGDHTDEFLFDAKSRNIVRKKMYLMYGAEPGLIDTVSVDPVTNSLSEGWDISKFPVLNNSLRAGSYNRGAETQLGGESVKWLLRSSSNIVVSADDCGSRMGKKFDVTKDTSKNLVGFSIVTEEGHKLIESEEEAGTYLGKTLMVRSPLYCTLDKTDYCSTCIGKRLAVHPTGLSLAVSSYGSKFMGIFMAAGHSKGLMLAKMDYKTAIT